MLLIIMLAIIGTILKLSTWYWVCFWLYAIARFIEKIIKFMK